MLVAPEQRPRKTRELRLYSPHLAWNRDLAWGLGVRVCVCVLCAVCCVSSVSLHL